MTENDYELGLKINQEIKDIASKIDHLSEKLEELQLKQSRFSSSCDHLNPIGSSQIFSDPYSNKVICRICGLAWREV